MDLSVIAQFDKLSTISESEIIRDWLLNAEISENSQETYQRQVIKYIHYLKINGYSSSTRNSIIEYKNYMVEHYSTGTAYVALSSIKSLYKYLEMKGISSNIARDVKLPKIQKGFKKDCLTLPQVVQLLDSLDEVTLSDMRDKVMVNLFIRCGLRTCELRNADIEDIRTRDGQKVLYIKGKGHLEKDDFVILTDDMVQLIDKYLVRRKNYIDKSPLFVSFSNRSYGKRLDSSTIRSNCKWYLRRIGLDSPRITTHSFRHTAITLATSANASLMDVKEFARHTNINTTLNYIHNLKRMENAPEFKIDELLKTEDEK